jgi:hypothetical protein
MRTLIDEIVLIPACQDGKGTLSNTLHGHLAGILGLAAKAKGHSMRATLWWSAQNGLRGRATTDRFSCRRYQSEDHVEKSSLAAASLRLGAPRFAVFV